MYRQLCFVFCSSVVLMVSCKEKPASENTSIVKGVSINQLPVAADLVKGTYSGDFKGSPISITFRYLSGNHISGYNVHKGLKRNVTGTIELSGSKLHVQVSEPGTNPYDGNFDLWIDTLTWRGKGRWKPMEKGEDVAFTFRKKIDKENEDYSGIYSLYEDSARNTIELRSDGTCFYSYVSDSTTQQQLTIRGNFRVESDSTMNIFWQKNNLFPAGKSVFRMKRVPVEPENDFWVLSLIGEGSEFMQYWD